MIVLILHIRLSRQIVMTVNACELSGFIEFIFLFYIVGVFVSNDGTVLVFISHFYHQDVGLFSLYRIEMEIIEEHLRYEAHGIFSFDGIADCIRFLAEPVNKVCISQVWIGCLYVSQCGHVRRGGSVYLVKGSSAHYQLTFEGQIAFGGLLLR